MPRALELASELYLAFEDAGCRVVLGPTDRHYHRPSINPENERSRVYGPTDPWYPARPTVAFVANAAFGLTLYELTEEVEVRYVNGKYVPVSDLPPSRRLMTDSFHSWTTKGEVRGQVDLVQDDRLHEAVDLHVLHLR